MNGGFFFFFKQKTAYEIMPSLVGSEMCIRDRYTPEPEKLTQVPFSQKSHPYTPTTMQEPVSYTHLTLPTIYSV
ncbi:hypothetical protein BN3590_02257 [Clostridium sp. C105KSO15]|nr:hypothetical protein BN3590_02257 [Clostridium sp. C105KSO15]